MVAFDNVAAQRTYVLCSPFPLFDRWRKVAKNNLAAVDRSHILTPILLKHSVLVAIYYICTSWVAAIVQRGHTAVRLISHIHISLFLFQNTPDLLPITSSFSLTVYSPHILNLLNRARAFRYSNMFFLRD